MFEHELVAQCWTNEVAIRSERFRMKFFLDSIFIEKKKKKKKNIVCRVKLKLQIATCDTHRRWKSLRNSIIARHKRKPWILTKSFLDSCQSSVWGIFTKAAGERDPCHNHAYVIKKKRKEKKGTSNVSRAASALVCESWSFITRMIDTTINPRNRHSFGEQFSARKWAREVAGQREILSAYGGVKLEDVRGMRAPFLSVMNSVYYIARYIVIM